MKTGKIVIKEKVYFEPDGLEKPKKSQFTTWDPFDEHPFECFDELSYKESMIKYEASKQLVWIEDVFYNDIMGKWLFGAEMKNRLKLALRELVITDNQPCKAEINNNKATIIELI